MDRELRLTCALGALACLPAQHLHAAAFNLQEQSASRLGTAFAGTAVVTEDPSAMYFNVAGLAQLDARQAAIVATGVRIQSQFENEGSVAALGQPLGDEGGDAGAWNLVPAAYLAWPLSDALTFGFGVNVPFGLALRYDDDWLGRFQSRRSEIQTINLNPALAWEVNDRLSIGVGLNYQRVQAVLTNAFNYSAIVFGATGQFVPGLSGGLRLEGEDETWGYNVGVLFELSDATHLGLSYRSSSDYTLEGDAVFTPPSTTQPVAAAVIAAVSGPNGLFASSPATVDLELPDIAIASISHQLTPNLRLLADVAWTGWSSVQELKVVRGNGRVLSTTPELWDDTWRISIGAEWEWRNDLTLRAGVMTDESAVPDSTRTARLPDEERILVGLGARWTPTEAMVIDIGYAHLFVDDAPLDQDDGNAALYGVLRGEQTSAIDIVSTQFTYRF